MKQAERLKSSRVDIGFITLETRKPQGFQDKSEGKSDDKPLMLSTHGVNSEISSTTDNSNEYFPYAFPSNPTIFDYIFFVPLAINHSITNMSRAFGWKFVFMIVIVYGVQQGMGNAFFFFARDYYFKDVEKLQPAQSQTYIAASMTPWNIKPLYGMLSDSLSIFGYHRIPYIMMAGAGGGFSLLLLSLIPLTALIAVALMFMVNLSVASPDVMIDGVIAEKVKSHPKFATDLQSLCWGSQAIFAIAGHLTSGYAVNQFGSRTIFGGLALSSVAITVPAMLNWLGEVPEKYTTLTAVENSRFFCYQTFKINLDNCNTHRRIFVLAFIVSGLALLMSVCALLITHWLPRLLVAISIALLVVLSVWFSLKDTLPDVARAAMFIFLTNCLTPDIDTAMFYWITDDPGGPQFDPPFMGYISAGSFFAMFMGVLLYNYYFSSWTYKKIFTFAIVILSFMNIFDVILVERWNLKFGIPDKMLVLGDSALSPVARRFLSLPMVILAAKVCPDGAEATLFAMMMSLSNFGAAVSVYLGALLLMVLGIQSGDYSNLTYAIIIKAFCRLLPLLLIPLLVPNGSPSDPALKPGEDVMVDTSQGSTTSMELTNRHHPVTSNPLTTGNNTDKL
eukprot:gene3967-7905_t